MRNLFIIIFSVIFTVPVWATTPPGLYDNVKSEQPKLEGKPSAGPARATPVRKNNNK